MQIKYHLSFIRGYEPKSRILVLYTYLRSSDYANKKVYFL